MKVPRKDILEMARIKATSTHEQGSEEWFALYYGFVYGFQECMKILNSKPKKWPT